MILNALYASAAVLSFFILFKVLRKTSASSTERDASSIASTGPEVFEKRFLIPERSAQLQQNKIEGIERRQAEYAAKPEDVSASEELSWFEQKIQRPLPDAPRREKAAEQYLLRDLDASFRI